MTHSFLMRLDEIWTLPFPNCTSLFDYVFFKPRQANKYGASFSSIDDE